MRILVIGGTGFLGRPVARALGDAGHPVRIMSRHPSRAHRTFGPGADIVAGDVGDIRSLVAAMTGCYGVHVSLSGAGRPETFDRVEHRGVAAVARAAAEAGVTHITQTSGAATYADEDVYFVRAKYLGEQALLDGPVCATVLRASWFMEALARMVKGPLAVIPGIQPHPVHFIAVRDFCRMVVAAYRTPAAGNRVLLAYGPEALTVDDALGRYCRARAPHARVVHVPLAVMRAGTLLAPPGIRFLADLLEYFERRAEPSGPGEAPELLGPNTTTLDMWLAGDV